MKLCVPSSHTAAEVWGDQGHLWELQTLTIAMDHLTLTVNQRSKRVDMSDLIRYKYQHYIL